MSDRHVSPEQFEKRVLRWVRRESKRLKVLRVEHRGMSEGEGGEYEIDVLLEIELLGSTTITVLIECKRWRSPVKREQFLALESKLRDVGAHKGMIFSTSGFQEGAVKYAEARGIAAVEVVNRSTTVIAKADVPKPPADPEDVVGWFTTPGPDGGTRAELIDDDYTEPLARWFAR